MGEIQIQSNERVEFIDISNEVKRIIMESGLDNGLCIIYCPHTTSAITINENADSSVVNDIINKLNKMVPTDENYSHSEGNSDAHIKASIIGASETVIIEKGKLLLGRWQGIFFCEFDGPRNRKIIVNIVKR